MTDEISDLYDEMTERLHEVVLTTENAVQGAVQSYHIVENTLGVLKEIILKHDFKDTQEEITFFKKTKPMFLKELIYFFEVYQAERFRPPVGGEGEIAHYMLGTKKVDFYLKRYNDLYTYYRSGSCVNDGHYFLRGEFHNDDMITPVSKSDMNTEFSTTYSFQFAKMQAYERFGNYIRQCIYRLEHPEAAQAVNENKDFRLTWTDAKADLIELGYSLHAIGSVNHGKADIKQIMSALEKVFNISVGNFYRTFQEIRIRKKGRTTFLDNLKDRLLRRMDETDENPRL